MRTYARAVTVRGVLLAGLWSCAPRVVPPEPVVVAATDDAARSAFGRARLAQDRGDADAAARELEWVTRLDEGPWAALAAGRLRLERGDLDGAERDLTRAASALPGEGEVARALATLRAAQGRPGEARDLWLQAARAGDEDAWSRALEGAEGGEARAIVAAWTGVAVSGAQRSVRAAAARGAGLWREAVADGAAAMAWVATPDALQGWSAAYVQAGCAGEDPAEWMRTHGIAGLGAGWIDAWADACVTLVACKPFDEAERCLDGALEVTAPGLQRSRLIEARSRLEMQRR